MSDVAPEVERCRLFHRWTKWSGLKSANSLVDGKKVGDVIYQERACERCNKIQYRTVVS